MSPEEQERLLMKIDKLERKVGTLTKYISTRGGVVQINAPLSIKGDIEFKEVHIFSNTGAPPATGTVPVGSIYLRKGGASGASLYTNSAAGWNDY